MLLMCRATAVRERCTLYLLLATCYLVLAIQTMRTVSGITTYEDVVKGSRFIAHSARVDSVEETTSFLAEVADPSATHNCWAWRIDEQYRSSDDGEPGGTAGRPILATLDGHHLDHVMVVVTRYFGGTKLGTGGLVRAYGGVASKCLDRASIIEEQALISVSVSVDFAHAGAVHQLVGEHGGRVETEDFVAEGVTATVAIPEPSVDAFRTALMDATSGQAQILDPFPEP